DFHLGLIANQGAECRDRLAALGWLERFAVVAFAEEMSVFKPDRALFEQALARAGGAPEYALMVGDRLGNDIAPAAALGMTTAWLRWPRRAAKGWPADRDPEALAYLASLERTSQSGTPPVVPTLALDTMAELTGRRIAESFGMAGR